MPKQVPTQIVYDGEGFYNLRNKKRFFYREFLKLLCQKNYGRKINICIVSENIHEALIKFGSLLVDLKGRNNGLEDHLGKYKVFAFPEFQQFKQSEIASNTHIIFHWMNPNEDLPPHQF